MASTGDIDSDDAHEEQVQRLVYDCTPWSGESRRLFASMLDYHEIVNAWQGTEVTILSSDREEVDDLVEQVLSTTRSAIDDEASTIVYEMSGWPDALQNEFAVQLTISEVAYEWNVNGDIVVNAEDEDRVEEVLDMLPLEDEYDPVDGLEVHGLLNELFMVCDRLVSKPTDESAMQSLRSLASGLERIPLPFGFDEKDWSALVLAVTDVGADETKRSHKSLAKVAASARDRIRQYV